MFSNLEKATNSIHLHRREQMHVMDSLPILRLLGV